MICFRISEMTIPHSKPVYLSRGHLMLAASKARQRDTPEARTGSSITESATQRNRAIPAALGSAPKDIVRNVRKERQCHESGLKLHLESPMHSNRAFVLPLLDLHLKTSLEMWETNGSVMRLTDNFAYWATSFSIFLRDLLVTQVTIFIARRGGEPARLLMHQWEEAYRGDWLMRESVDEVEQQEREHLPGAKIAYQ